MSERLRTGIMRIWKGMKFPAMKKANRIMLPRKRYLASEKAASDEMARAPMQVGTVMSTLFQRKRPMGVAVKTPV